MERRRFSPREKLKIVLEGLRDGGTGYSTAKLAQRVESCGTVLAIDLTPGMIEKAKARMRDLAPENVEFRIGDVLEQLEGVPEMSFDVATVTWLIGYVGCDEIFPLLRRVLKPGGYVGFVVHLDRSPLVPIEVFEGIVRDNPASLTKAVKFKFPKDAKDAERHLRDSDFSTQWMKQGSFNYVGKTGKDVFDHVMESGAATTFYYSLRPSDRERLSKEFVDQVNKRFAGAPEIVISHDYVVGIGVRQP
jgi:ubiquinone/menaquinone biosynthesis C-methylase UbiE